MDPLTFPQRAVPLIGQSHIAHPTWIIAAPITCNCEAKTPLTVMFGNGCQPAICPGCLNVYGIVALQGGGNVPFGVGIAVIAKAQKRVADADVAEKIAQIAESVN